MHRRVTGVATQAYLQEGGEQAEQQVRDTEGRSVAAETKALPIRFYLGESRNRAAFSLARLLSLVIFIWHW